MVGTLGLIHFYYVIVKTFSNNTFPEVIEMMECWQQYIFPPSPFYMPDDSVPTGRFLGMKVGVPPGC